MKKFGLVAVAVSALLAVGCSKKEAAASDGNSGGKAGEDASKKLVVWSFTDEIEGLINNYYKPAHPDMEIEYALHRQTSSPASWTRS